MVWYAKESKVLDFLHKISKDPEMQAKFEENPVQVMKDEGLSEDEIKLLQNRDCDGVLKNLLYLVKEDDEGGTAG